MQGAFRVGVCLFMLSGSCVLSAQEATGNAPATRTATAKKPAPSNYVMKEVKGKVIDAATGKPLAGVRLQALNNRLYSAMTEDDGSYTIRIPEFVNTLYVALENYNPAQLAIKGAEGQDLKLQSGMLSDFYPNGTKLNNNSSMMVNDPNAITIEEEIEKGLGGSVRAINRGGMPGQGAAMFINGLNSLNTNAQPLVIIDGVMVDMQYDRTSLHDGFVTNVFNIVDPDDIESVEVVKNGTALYGAKGGNGVLLINTKRGKSLVTRIKFRAYGGFQQTPERTKMMNASQYRSYLTEMLGTLPDIDMVSSSQNIPFLIDDPNYKYYDLYHNDTDWAKDLYHETFTQNYKVSVDGGDDVAMYNLSLGYTQADATARNNDFNRLNIRFNTDINLFDGFLTGLDIAYARNAYNLRDNGWAESYANRNISSPNVLGLVQTPFISPYAHFMSYNQADGTLTLYPNDKVYSGKNYSDTNNPFVFAESFGYSGLVNPYWVLANGQGDNKNFQEQTQFNINVSPSYKVNKYLTLSDRFSYILNRTNEKYYLPNSGTPPKEVEGLGDVTSIVRTQFAKETTLYNDFRIAYNRAFRDHNVNVFGGFRLNSYSYNASNISGYNNDQDKMPNMSYSLQYKEYGGVNDTWTNLAYYLQANYDYRNRYYLQAGATMEASSRFGKEAKDGVKIGGVAWGLFPSVQAGWVVTSEDWFDVAPINYLKLTAGYEISGNDNVDYYASRTYFANTKFMDRATALVLANIQNPEIQWETNHRFNVGMQASLFDNRLNLSAEYFNSRTTDLLTRKSVSDITGLSYMWANDGELKNSGVEANLNALLVTSGDFRWQAGFSVGHYKNEITQLPSTNLNLIKTYKLDENGVKIEDSERTIHGYTSGIYGENNVLTAVGHAAGVFYGYQTKGVFASAEEASRAHTNSDGTTRNLRYPTGITQDPYRNFGAGDVHFVDQNNDGWINEADMTIIGDPNPDIYGNFYTTFAYKGFSLDLNFKYSLGNDVFNYQRQQLESANNIYNQTTAVVNRWRYNGQTTDVPRAVAVTSESWVNNERFSDRWIEDGSFLKLKKVRLTYKVPVNLSWLLGLQVWGEANNVFTVTKYTGTDPEFSCGNGVLYQGIDAGYLAQSRNFNLGVTINL